MPTARKVPEHLKKALRQAGRPGSPMPHLSELAEFFIEEAGGARALARMLYTEWVKAPAGGVVRARILDLITRVWRFASETHGKPEELGLLTDDDLERQLLERLASLGAADDAQTQEAAAPAPAGRADGEPLPAAGLPDDPDPRARDRGG